MIAATVALNVNLGAKKSGEVSLLALVNIEALADGESGSSCTVSTNCYTDPWDPKKLTGTVSCTGKVCSRTDTSVTCDSQTTSC